MSRLLRPVGHLPARVYWTRRLLLVALLVLVVVLVWWLVGRGGSAGASASDDQAGASSTTGSEGSQDGARPTSPPQTTTSPTQSPETTQSETSSTETTQPQTEQAPTSSRTSERTLSQHSQSRNTKTPERKTATAQGTKPPCDPREVDISLRVSDASSGQGNPVTFRLSTSGSQACMLEITPDTLAVEVTSGSDTVWSSSDCPDQLPAKRVTVGQKPDGVYTFTWNGRRSTDRCAAAGEVAQPGGYWVRAALIGGEPHKTYFEVTP